MKPIKNLPTRPILIMLSLLMLVLSGCASSTNAASQPSMAMPDFLRDAPATVKEAYQYAMQHPDELEKYPCYCGCRNMGHTSNRSCYIKEIAANGSITFDSHALGCGLCVDITKDVMRLKAEGQTSSQIRTYIDAQYSSYGPSTNTPLPKD